MLIPISISSSDKQIKIGQEIEKVTFESLGLAESHVEEFLRQKINLLFESETEGGESLLIVGQQVVNLKGARNDLVAIDAEGNLVLIEIKRDAADMAGRVESLEFQAVRYAASLASIATVDELVDRVFARYIKKWSSEFGLGDLTEGEKARRLLDDFLIGNGAANSFNRKQRIMLVSSTFDEQTLAAVAWMNANGVDISCISLNPIRSAGQVFLSAEMLIPSRKIEDFYIEIREGTSVSNEVHARTGAAKTRTALPRMAKLIEWGIVQPGMSLTIRSYQDSVAEVIDAKTVKFKGQVISFNDWGTKVTEWSAICIYDWAVTPDGETLTSLRARHMAAEAEKREKDMGEANATSEFTSIPPTPLTHSVK